MHRPVRTALVATFVAALAAVAAPAFADDDDDDRRKHWRHGHPGHGYGYGYGAPAYGYGPGWGGGPRYRESYWDGACRVERKIDGNGRYKEKRSCPGYGWRPAYPQGGGWPVAGGWGAPAVVIQPPAIVIR